MGGLEEIGDTTSEGFLSSIISVFTDLKYKYPDAQVYRGFVPEQKKEVVDERFDEAEALMDKAIATLKAQGNEDKPKLIITGHSLGGARTKTSAPLSLMDLPHLSLATQSTSK